MAKHSIQQTKLGVKPPVTVKGTKHGLLFLLDEHCAVEELVQGLKDLLEGSQSGLFTGAEVNIFVDYGSRQLSSEDNRTLLNLFLKQENFVIREWAARTTARKSLFHNDDNQVRDYVLHKGTVRSGQDLQFEGDVIVIGDINPGGQISATGDIYIFGRLHGIAHAGSQGNAWAVIAAIDFAPMQLRIGNYVGYAPEQEGKPLRSQLEFAYVKNDAMAVDKLQFLTSFLQYRTQMAYQAQEIKQPIKRSKIQ